MSEQKSLYEQILSMCKESETLTKEIVDTMFSSMKGVMTLINKNFRWGYIDNEDWEDSYAAMYIYMSSYIGRSLEKHTDVFAYLGRATAKHLFNLGKGKVKSKKQNINYVYEADMVISKVSNISGDSRTESTFEYLLLAEGKYDENQAEDDLESEVHKKHLISLLPRDRHRFMCKVYDGMEVKDITRVTGLSHSYVRNTISKLRRDLMKSKTYGKEEDIYC